MGSLCFPQLASGALAQYPVKKMYSARTIKNVLPDGSMILVPDPAGAWLAWQLVYTDISAGDMGALQNHFDVCRGAYRAFTFIDPTENMLVSSADLTTPAWLKSSLIHVAVGLAGPDGTGNGFTLINTGQTDQEISQDLEVPANYQYCFSLYAKSNQPLELVLVRKSGSAEQSTSFAVGTEWNRIVSSGRLNDSGNSFTVSISLAPGQQVEIYGPQLEAQTAPSRYRPTQGSGGVYLNAHWGVDQLITTATGPGLFSTAFTIETAI